MKKGLHIKLLSLIFLLSILSGMVIYAEQASIQQLIQEKVIREAVARDWGMYWPDEAIKCEKVTLIDYKELGDDQSAVSVELKLSRRQRSENVHFKTTFIYTLDHNTRTITHIASSETGSGREINIYVYGLTEEVKITERYNEKSGAGSMLRTIIVDYNTDGFKTQEIGQFESILLSRGNTFRFSRNWETTYEDNIGVTVCAWDVKKNGKEMSLGKEYCVKMFRENGTLNNTRGEYTITYGNACYEKGDYIDYYDMNGIVKTLTEGTFAIYDTENNSLVHEDVYSVNLNPSAFAEDHGPASVVNAKY